MKWLICFLLLQTFYTLSALWKVFLFIYLLILIINKKFFFYLEQIFIIKIFIPFIGYYSFRDTNRGSWYIQTLCKVIKEHWKDCDMLKMLTITLRKVATEYSSQHDKSSLNNKRQMPTFTSTLTRDLYFNSNFVEQ